MLASEARRPDLKAAKHAGITVCNGSDLLGDMRKHQAAELVICAQKLVIPLFQCCRPLLSALVHRVIAYPLSSHLQGAHGALKAATSSCAELFNMSGQVGKLAPGAFAGVKLSAVRPVVTLDLLGYSEQHIP